MVDTRAIFIQWEAEENGVQPINSFLIIVVEVAMDFRRQIKEGNTTKTYETRETHYTLRDIDLNKTYVIQVCAKNMVSDNCSDETIFHPLMPPTIQATEEPEVGVSIIVYIIIAVILAVICIGMHRHAAAHFLD